MRNPTISEYWYEAKEKAQKRWNRGEPEFPTEIKFVDKSTDGLHRGEVWIVAGKPGSGKTSLSLQLAQSFASNPKHSIMFLSLEMKGYELVTRMFCEMMDVDYNNFREGLLPKDYPKKDKIFREHIQKIDFEIFEYGFTFEEVEKIIRTAYHKKRPDVIFLDFMQLIEWRSFKDERLALMEYIRRMKELAKKLDIGIVAVSQLRRLPSGANYQRPPDIVDLKGSGSLEQTADVVILVYYEQEEEGPKSYFMNLAKNKHGKTEQKSVTFEGSKYRFKEI